MDHHEAAIRFTGLPPYTDEEFIREACKANGGDVEEVIFFDDKGGGVVLKGAVVKLKNADVGDTHHIVHVLKEYGHGGLSFGVEEI